MPDDFDIENYTKEVFLCSQAKKSLWIYDVITA